MDKMVLLARGEKYPLAIQSNDGATANFLMPEGNTLKIRLHLMTSQEEWSIRNGMIKAALLKSGDFILLLFVFYDQKGRCLLDFECPFDGRLIPSDTRQMFNIENDQQRLAIDIHAVDEQMILRVIRFVTMPPKMTVEFLSAVMDQSLMPVSGSQNPFGDTPISELMASVETYWLGQ